MATSTSIERQRAVAWIVRQLAWERALEALRRQANAGHDEQRAAA